LAGNAEAKSCWRAAEIGYTSVVNDKPNTVHIVVDLSFGHRLAELPADEPVWIVGSPANTPEVLRLWSERPRPQFSGITKFDLHAESSEGILLNELNMINLHHGEHSADPPWSVAVVYGVGPTPAIAKAFAEIGFTKLTSERDGFIAQRES
jgi:hypothetical protein